MRYAGKLEVDLRPVSLRAAAAGPSGLLRAAGGGLQKVQIHVRPGPELTVWADDRLLKQTVLNLMLNAVQGDAERRRASCYQPRGRGTTRWCRQ